MNPISRTCLPAAALLALVLLAGCNDRPTSGKACSHPGDVYAHGATRVTCGQDGRWHK
jgi:hypothetical protein